MAGGVYYSGLASLGWGSWLLWCSGGQGWEGNGEGRADEKWESKASWYPGGDLAPAGAGWSLHRSPAASRSPRLGDWLTHRGGAFLKLTRLAPDWRKLKEDAQQDLLPQATPACSALQVPQVLWPA